MASRLKLRGLDDTARDNFASAGLASRLETVTTQLLLLPFDPEQDVVPFSDELSDWLRSRATVPLDSGQIRLGETITRTAHAVALVEPYNTAWTSYLAVHRSGTLELGMGERGAWSGNDRHGQPVYVFALTPTVARVWALLRVAAALAKRADLTGPYQLTVAMRGTRDALLGALGEGWAEPGSFQNRVEACFDQDLLWHIELDALPEEEEERRDLAYAVGDRIEHAWGSQDRRYLARHGKNKGQLDPQVIT